ncbi:putative RNA polymerase sigma factor [Brevibacillus phage SecTim467]|uniref:Putative RNA polymerase sigma factor n=2 Tax=Jenstvirus jenst TaxID=1982225 RepID=A0A0K2CPD8_9CAUD|nr:RNA polymerase sigma factor [Brevibacillus phage Jenst]ALA07203.1 putative RNA polymerase sigma factor [Brevibacillus phage Jenst]ALA07424.1 putative RNA polymerase sigma factor [Brevibacillus phage SecTim467]
MLSNNYLQLRKEEIPDMHNMELIRACKADKELLGEFLKENKDFVFSIIMHFKGSIEELKAKFRVSEDELLQHAYIGILTALQEFDFNRGIKFTTFVVRPILWEINQLLYSDSRTVRLSRGAVELIKRMVEIEDTLGYRPNEDEMSELLKISVERYREIARFSDELEHFDAIVNFDIVDTPDKNIEEDVTNRVYIQQLLADPMFTDFERQVMRLVMDEANNTQIAERLKVYPMTVNRTLARIRNKLVAKETNTSEDKGRIASKYEKEINLIAQETKERNELMCIEDIVELLEVCGYATSQYTTRVLYYIRQKAIQQSSM